MIIIFPDRHERSGKHFMPSEQGIAPIDPHKHMNDIEDIARQIVHSAFMQKILFFLDFLPG